MFSVEFMYVGTHVVIILNSINISVLLIYVRNYFLAAGSSMLGIACQTML